MFYKLYHPVLNTLYHECNKQVLGGVYQYYCEVWIHVFLSINIYID